MGRGRAACRRPARADSPDHPDETIAADAFECLSLAPFEELAALRDEFPRRRLRAWLSEPGTPPPHCALYGMMLGLCGDGSDAELLGRIALDSTDEFRPGIDGVMFGYLLLTGEAGLRRLERAKFTRRTAALLSEMHAGLEALRLMWDHGGGRIPRDRLKESMRLLLDHPELAYLAVTELTRWRDWGAQDRLVRLYGTAGYTAPRLKRAVVRFLVAAASDSARDPDGNLGRHVIDARREIERLRRTDPETVRKVELFTFRE